MTTPTTEDHTVVHAKGHGWAIMVPTTVVCAVIVALTNLITRPGTEAHAAAPADDGRTERDVRELREDVKKLIDRTGKLEDAVNNLGARLDARKAP